MRARRTVGQMAIAGLALLGALVLLAPFAQAAFPGRDGQIAYGTVESVYEIGVLGFGPIKAVTPNDPQHPTVLVEGKASNRRARPKPRSKLPPTRPTASRSPSPHVGLRPEGFNPKDGSSP